MVPFEVIRMDSPPRYSTGNCQFLKDGRRRRLLAGADGDAAGSLTLRVTGRLKPAPTVAFMFSRSQSMKLIKIVTSILLVAASALPAMASSDWVEDFLRRYDRGKVTTVAANSPEAIGQLIRTGEVPVTLNDVINMMIDNNLDIRSNRLGPRSSYWASLVFYRALQPSLRFSGTVNRNSNLSNSQLNGTLPTVSQLRGNYSVGFSQLLPTGTSLAVDATMNRLSSSSNLNTFNPSYTGQLTYTVGQHLLRDRGRLANTRQIIIGQNNEKISETEFEIQLTSLLVQAQKSYWDLVFAGQDLDVKQRSLDLAQRTLDENKMKVEIGTLAPVDVLQTQADVASRREQLVVSTYNVTAAEDQIKKMTSSDKDPSIFLMKLRAQESPKRPDVIQVPTLEEGIKIALENRPEMRQALLEIENKDIDVRYTHNQRLPTLDVTATYNQNGTGGTQIIRGNVVGGAASGSIPGGINNAFGQLFSYNYTGYSLGFSFTLPLSNKAADADHERALNEQRLSKSKLEVFAQQIALDVRNALTQVEMNRARIETAKTTRELAQLKMQAEQDKFSLGTSTLRFVLEEQRNVAQTETNELQSVVNFTKSLVDLDKAMGLTLQKNSVEVDKTLTPVASNVRSGSMVKLGAK
jgi:outer membrane protein TolC